MNRFKIYQALKFVFIFSGIFLGFYLTNLSSQHHSETTHSQENNHSNKNHGKIDLTNECKIPEIVSLKIYKDPIFGWNLNLKTKNFRFKPENAGKKHKSGEGHAHLWINGTKVARIYGNWFHIGDFKNLNAIIEVTLNANSHETFLFKNKIISKKIMLFE